MTRAHRNISFATVDSLEAILRKGSLATTRGRETKELRNYLTRILRPLERCVFLPGRRNDIFAQIAETFWVIGGHDDLPWLTRYLKRAPQFSDDGGSTWRGAYGPRLRNWHGRVDQLAEWRSLLLSDSFTRRAAGILFDPCVDFAPESKDIPCNNWLSWLLRENRLHLNVAIRSNDAMWGFSGINAFEWSVLQEMMSFWVGAEVGEVTYFATSYHLYSDYYSRAKEIVAQFRGVTPYDFNIGSPRFCTPWETFASSLSTWFSIEEQIRTDPETLPEDRLATLDPYLAGTLCLLRLKWGARIWADERLASELGHLPEDDLTTAAYEYFGRSRPALLTDIPQPKIHTFFRAYKLKGSVSKSLKPALKHLHARKNLSYAGSWKRRGERVSILPNIARKVDRLHAFVDNRIALEDESVFDTAIDLYVYTLKYLLFLAEAPGADNSFLGTSALRPYSDHNQNFDAIVDAAQLAAPENTLFETLVAHIHICFELLWRRVDDGAEISERQRLANELASTAESLVAVLAAQDSSVSEEFIRREIGAQDDA